MTPQELKSSILQLAIQGKLVEQRPEEGTAAELLEKILVAKNAEGAKGVKKKLTRSRRDAETTKELDLASNVSRPVEDAPFDIPESWEWVRLEDLVIKDIKRGKSPTYTQKSGTLVFAQKCNTKAGVINLSLALFLDEAKLSKYPESEFMRDCDIVINSTGNGTLGRVGIYRDSDNPNKLPVVPDSHVTVIRVGEKVSVEYVFYCLKHYQPLLEKLCSGSTNQTELSASTVKSLLFPLPPLAEQKRIVAKIEELMPLVDRYEKAWSRLEDFNKRFPVDMQKSLLQMAIQGKLVEQRADEGTAAELLEKILAAKNAKDSKGKGEKSHAKSAKSAKVGSRVSREEIPDDEKPFDIPESWEWVRLYEIADSIQYGYSAPARQSGRIRMVRISDIQNGKINWNTVPFCDIAEKDVERYLVEAGDVLFARTGGTVGKSYLVRDTPQESIYAGYLIRTRFLSCVLPQFAKIFFESDIYWKQLKSGLVATAQPNFNGKKLASMLIPLPPLAEQKRIVAKLEELLPLCERLKSPIHDLIFGVRFS